MDSSESGPAIGPVETWVVEVGEPTAMTFWISERAPYITRPVLPMSGGEASFHRIGWRARPRPVRPVLFPQQGDPKKCDAYHGG